MHGYSMPLATPARTSFVRTLPRAYSEFLPSVPAGLAVSLGPPVGVAIDGNTNAVVFQYTHGAIVARDNQLYGLAAAPERDASLVALPEGVVIGDELHPWDMSPPRMLDSSAPRGRAVVAAALGNCWFTVRQSTVDASVDTVTIRRTALSGPPNPQSRSELGYACAAIDHGGRIGLSFASGRFCVLDPGSLVERLELRREHPAYLVSAIAPGWCIVSADPNTDQSTAPVERRARVSGLPGHHIRGMWHSRIERINDEGDTQWSVRVPFPVLQPPVYAGGPRFYLVGKGLAALDGGRVTWQKPANIRLMATCFGDGTLALVAGSQVRILERDGTLRQTLTIPDRSRILTLPSIGPNGAIYVGTLSGFYVAR